MLRRFLRRSCRGGVGCSRSRLRLCDVCRFPLRFGMHLVETTRARTGRPASYLPGRKPGVNHLSSALACCRSNRVGRKGVSMRADPNFDMNTLWFLYGLRKPGQRIRYVGITRNRPSIRHRAHWHSGSQAKRRWFCSGSLPTMEILGSLRGTLRMAIEVEVTLSKALAAEGSKMLNREARFQQ